jgi:FKBP-type peptidyl-prolyl cis-trans isomerase FkpA
MRLSSVVTLAALLVPLALATGCQKSNDKGQSSSAPVEAKPKPKAAPGELPDDTAKTFYALGLDVGTNLKIFTPTDEEVGFIMQGFKDGVAGADPKADLQEWGPKIQGLAQARQKATADKAKEASVPVLAELAKTKGAKKTASGLVFIEEKAGTGLTPKSGDRVKVNYKGTLADGTVFDESKAPVEFTVGQVVPCWNEALTMMKPGAAAKIGCPAELGYGDRGAPPKIPGGAGIFFHIDLLEVTPGTGMEGMMGGAGAAGANMDPRAQQQMDPRMMQQLQQQMQMQMQQQAAAKGAQGAPPAPGKGH